MLKLLLSRLATAIPSIVGVVIVTFMLTRLLPGDPAAYFAGLAASPQAIAEVRTKLGLDKTLPEQFVAYIGDLLHGNLGNSLSTGQPVVAEIATRLPASAELTLFALILAVAIAIPLGVLAAVKQGTWIDHLCRIVTTAGVSLPVFFTGLILVYVFYYLLGWAPAPLGRLDAFSTPPKTITGAFLIDSAIAGNGRLFLATAKQLVLPTLTLGVFAIHLIVLYGLQHRPFHGLALGATTVPQLTYLYIATVVLSFVAAWVMSKVPYLRRIV
jgi:peptide/nickel transport system permease protein